MITSFFFLKLLRYATVLEIAKKQMHISFEDSSLQGDFTFYVNDVQQYCNLFFLHNSFHFRDRSTDSVSLQKDATHRSNRFTVNWVVMNFHFHLLYTRSVEI